MDIIILQANKTYISIFYGDKWTEEGLGRS